MEFSTLFREFAALLAIAVAAGFIANRLRQPLIVAFIAVGILVGPPVMGLFEHNIAMELLAEFGIALLLFVVGLKLDLHLIKTMGPVSLATGLGQITFTATFVFLICQLLGIDLTASLYIAAAMSFSSTIIIVKLLSDKREIDSLHGRIAIGFLIVQDIMVVITMIVITAMGAAGEQAQLTTEVFSVLARGLLLLAGVALLMRYVLPYLLTYAATSTELLVLFSIALAISLAGLSDWIGFSKEVGAFLGGIALATTPYREAIGSRLISVRDFLLLFFFISLGAQLDFATLGAQVPIALLLSAFVLIGNPLIVVSIMGVMGFRRRTGFLAGLAVAQISEFSLILAALGFALGHINQETVGLITLVALITIAVSTYMILYSHALYAWLAPVLKPFERKGFDREAELQGAHEVRIPDVILFGLGRYGSHVARGLAEAGFDVLAVDFDPTRVKGWQDDRVAVRYGDAEDPDFIPSLPLSGVKQVISTVPQREVSISLLKALRAEGFGGEVTVTSHRPDLVEFYRQQGCDRVLLPYSDAADQAIYQIRQALQQGA